MARIRLILGVVVLAGLSSCQWFASREARTKAYIEEEMKQIDFNQLDQFPLFEICDETASKFRQQDCFESTMLMNLSLIMEENGVTFQGPAGDTLWLDFTVDQQGVVTLDSTAFSNATANKYPGIYETMSQSMSDLPPLEPALKRGVPVAAEFRIPLVLKAKE